MEALEVCSGLQRGGHYCSKGRAIFENVFESRLGWAVEIAFKNVFKNCTDHLFDQKYSDIVEYYYNVFYYFEYIFLF